MSAKLYHMHGEDVTPDTAIINLKFDTQKVHSTWIHVAPRLSANEVFTIEQLIEKWDEPTIQGILKPLVKILPALENKPASAQAFIDNFVYPIIKFSHVDGAAIEADTRLDQLQMNNGSANRGWSNAVPKLAANHQITTVGELEKKWDRKFSDSLEQITGVSRSSTLSIAAFVRKFRSAALASPSSHVGSALTAAQLLPLSKGMQNVNQGTFWTAQITVDSNIGVLQAVK